MESILSLEEKVAKYWKKTKVFESQQYNHANIRPRYTFYDGPPFATGKPHYGHILAGTMKDVVTRFHVMKGYHVPRQFGWDCHGLPVEQIVDAKIDRPICMMPSQQELVNYNEKCRSVVMQCEQDWEHTVERMGRWVDFKGSYKTMNTEFMSQLWGIFKRLHDNGLIYQGKKVMPVSTALGTPLSNFETNLNYKTVAHTDAYVLFPLLSSEYANTYLIAWTTTPWTLPAHVALCVHPEMDYVTYTCPETNHCYIVGSFYKVPSKWTEISRVQGKMLIGLKYEPPFPSLYSLKCSNNNPQEPLNPPLQVASIIADPFVKDNTGTGIIHLAPCFGEDDYRVCKENGFNESFFPCPVSMSGIFTKDLPEFEGRSVQDPAVCKDILYYLKQKTPNRLWKQSIVHHSYPHCWRTDTPLIYRAVTSWFLKVESIKEKLLENNRTVNWVPDHIGEHRFHNWLEQAKDWALSRTRFWGTPIPVWMSEDGQEVRVVSSREELEELTKLSSPLFDIHRDSIDMLEIPSSQGKGMLKRIPDVFDCWFESGAVPIIQSKTSPPDFVSADFVSADFVPADFVAEGLDQTRGWFYTTLVLSTALYDKAPYKNVLCTGLILAEDGKKMSKRLKNYTDPDIILQTYGADALRMYLLDSPVVKGETLRFRDEGVLDIAKSIILPIMNAVHYYREYAPSAYSNPQHSNNSNTNHNLFDRWILLYMKQFAEKMHKEFTNYHLDNLVVHIRKCVHVITNLYIRMNRYRFKKDTERYQAVSTLYNVLDLFSRAVAPIAPFLAEWMYQEIYLSTTSECKEHPYQNQCSVHTMKYPNSEDNDTDTSEEEEILLNSMILFEEMVEEVRRIRLENKRSMKSPLKKVEIVYDQPKLIAFLKEYLFETFQRELNIMDLELKTYIQNYVHTEIIPNRGEIGRMFGKQSKQVLEDIQRGVYHPSLEMGIHLDKKYTLKQCSQSGVSSKYYLHKQGHIVTIVDTTVDDQILFEETVRELTHTIQQLRKDLKATANHKCDMYMGPYQYYTSSLRDRIQKDLGDKNMFYYNDDSPIPLHISPKASSVYNGTVIRAIFSPQQ